jgi:catechol 2,3-dioxygenase
MLPPSTTIGSVTLVVKDLSRLVGFYEGALGFVRQGHEAGTVTLGASLNGPPLVILVDRPDAVVRPVRAPGLFHTAFLYPSRKELARILQRLVQLGTKFQGFADHLVSEAIYLADPEGNGVELYADRPRDKWRWSGSNVEMATESLDLEGLMAELGERDISWRGTPPDTRIGHIHLQVSDLPLAEAFWSGAVGFDVVQRTYPGALFVSAGQYHHHIGLNIWNSRRTSIPDEELTGLRSFSIQLPEQASLTEISDRLKTAVVNGRCHAQDPSGIAVDFFTPGH